MFKFKPEDIKNIRNDPWANHNQPVEDMLAEGLNKILEAHLKTLPRVFLQDRDEDSCTAKKRSYSTHTALLWGVEEIK